MTAHDTTPDDLAGNEDAADRSESERERLEALAARDSEEPGWRERYAPGSYGCHEALQMTSFLANAVASELLEHGAITQNAEWYELAERAHQALFDLYQAIGAQHLEADDVESTTG